MGRVVISVERDGLAIGGDGIVQLLLLAQDHAQRPEGSCLIWLQSGGLLGQLDGKPDGGGDPAASPWTTRVTEGRPGFAGVRRELGAWGPCRGPHVHGRRG